MNNILYISDNYARNVAGTKISIYNEMQRRDYNVFWQDKRILSKKTSDQLINQFDIYIKSMSINQIWLVHSGLTIPVEVKNYLNSKNITVIGFGMSDPYYFKFNERFPSYDIYVTNSIQIYNKYRSVIPMIYNPTACDLNFHKHYPQLFKKYFSTVIGRGKHPRFTDENMRIKDVQFLRNNDIEVEVFGKDWCKVKAYTSIDGKKFIDVINHSQIGLDLQDWHSPLAHRMMEYSACGTPVITRRRDEVLMHFKEDEEILLYDDKEELLDKLKYYEKDDTEKLHLIGQAAMFICRNEHNIYKRVNNLLRRLNEIIGEKVF